MWTKVYRFNPIICSEAAAVTLEASQDGVCVGPSQDCRDSGEGATGIGAMAWSDVGANFDSVRVCFVAGGARMVVWLVQVCVRVDVLVRACL